MKCYLPWGSRVIKNVGTAMRKLPSDLNFLIIFPFKTCHPGLSTKLFPLCPIFSMIV